ncbi:uncharacterized protein [Clytia hemisphaerica]|uniref:Uncharacterized protein n=1 Tax=Clytia hemisphaerica TaxID=252671 RepID=A0A7M5X430_9CNID|eukprot:TCONS_00017242-protein
MGLLHLVTVAALAQLGLAAQPSDPTPWPAQFTQTFKETFYYPVIGTHTTTGTYYYDFKNLRYRIDRANGRYDRYCGFNGVRAFQNTPCSQLVIKGQRWLIYPEKKDCCMCCTAAQGCGILKPDWTKGALFVNSDNGMYKWNQKGLQDNFYIERQSDRRMVRINQVPNDIQDYDPDSFKPTVDPKVFELPSYCQQKACSYASTCRAVGRR